MQSTNNVSKYVQISDFLLLEWEFNRDGITIPLSNPKVSTNNYGTKQYIDTTAIGVTNNIGVLNSVPLNQQRTSWYCSPTGDYYGTYLFNEASINITSYEHDILKLHIVAGYNFNDVGGLLLQLRALDTSNNLVDLSNFTYIRQAVTIGNTDVIKFASDTLYLGNKFYDKYIELKIPSVQELSGETTT